MSFLLRLGCALLASVGIAAAHGAVAAAETAAHHPAQERLTAAPVEAPREEAFAKTSPDAAMRQARGHDQASRATPATLSRGHAGPVFPSVRLIVSAVSLVVPSSRRVCASPRAPPALA